jgi:two-component system response regulator MprA
MVMPGDALAPVAATVEVLVVDDDAELLDTIRMTLELEGYRVSTATNGYEALARIDERLPALVLLDLSMPGMDGWAVHDCLRKRARDLLIVFMTGGDRAQSEAHIHDAAGYLAKPFEVDDLLETVAYFTSEM